MIDLAFACRGISTASSAPFNEAVEMLRFLSMTSYSDTFLVPLSLPSVRLTGIRVVYILTLRPPSRTKKPPGMGYAPKYEAPKK